MPYAGYTDSKNRPDSDWLFLTTKPMVHYNMHHLQTINSVAMIVIGDLSIGPIIRTEGLRCPDVETANRCLLSR